MAVIKGVFIFVLFMAALGVVVTLLVRLFEWLAAEKVDKGKEENNGKKAWNKIKIAIAFMIALAIIGGGLFFTIKECTHDNQNEEHFEEYDPSNQKLSRDIQ